MRTISKFLLVCTVAVVAVAIAAIPSEAQTKKKSAAQAPAEAAEPMPAATAGCGDGGFCSTNCNDSGCNVNICAADKRWVPAVLTPFCIKGQCPPRC